MNDRVKQIKVGVHPVSHKFEWESRRKWGGQVSPALRATDWKCPHCVLIEYE